jgi:hypothetical protein
MSGAGRLSNMLTLPLARSPFRKTNDRGDTHGSVARECRVLRLVIAGPRRDCILQSDPNQIVGIVVKGALESTRRSRWSETRTFVRIQRQCGSKEDFRLSSYRRKPELCGPCFVPTAMTCLRESCRRVDLDRDLEETLRIDSLVIPPSLDVSVPSPFYRVNLYRERFF